MLSSRPRRPPDRTERGGLDRVPAPEWPKLWPNPGRFRRAIMAPCRWLSRRAAAEGVHEDLWDNCDAAGSGPGPSQGLLREKVGLQAVESRFLQASDGRVGLTVGDGVNQLYVYPAGVRSSGEFTQAVIQVADVRAAVEAMRVKAWSSRSTTPRRRGQRTESHERQMEARGLGSRTRSNLVGVVPALAGWRPRDRARQNAPQRIGYASIRNNASGVGQFSLRRLASEVPRGPLSEVRSPSRTSRLPCPRRLPVRRPAWDTHPRSTRLLYRGVRPW